MQSGQLKIPPGYHPLDVEKEWGRLHVAILEREKLLRSEFERQAEVPGRAPRGELGVGAQGLESGTSWEGSREPSRQADSGSLPTAGSPAQP